MSPAQLVAFEIARDVRVEIESWSIRDAAIDAGVDPAQAVDVPGWMQLAMPAAAVSGLR